MAELQKFIDPRVARDATIDWVADWFAQQPWSDEPDVYTAAELVEAIRSLKSMLWLPTNEVCGRCSGSGWAPGSDADSRWPHNYACGKCGGTGGHANLKPVPPHLIEPWPPKAEGS
jgi:hypothetical protein